jgi:hypothetical protein
LVGTLAPFKSLQTELGVQFQHTLEANHVIDQKKQLWVGSVKKYNNQMLKMTFDYTQNTQLQGTLSQLQSLPLSNLMSRVFLPPSSLDSRSTPRGCKPKPDQALFFRSILLFFGWLSLYSYLFFVDAIGASILEYLQVIPNGILCFFPSYRLMEQLITRWRATELYNKFSEFKTPFCGTSSSLT